MNIKKWIKVNHTFRGVHGWKDCPIDVVNFLQDKHHHEFNMTVQLSVTDSNRELEFITIQLILDGMIKCIFPNYNTEENASVVVDKLRGSFPHMNTSIGECGFTGEIPYTANLGDRSCEHICELVICSLSKMFPYLNDIIVEVSEDGHYAGRVEYNNDSIEGVE